MNDFIQIIQKEIKTTTDYNEIEAFIRKFVFAYYQTKELVEQLAKASEYVQVKENDQYLMHEGFYFIVDGEYQVQKKFIKLPNFLVVPTHEKCVLFSKTETYLLLVKQHFHEYVTQLKQLRLDIIVEFLQKTLFPNFPKNSVAKLARHFCLITLPFNYVIYKEQDESKNIYFIREGEIRLISGKKQLKLLTENQIFGEYEVFFNKKRPNKAICYSQVSLLYIKGEVFLALLREYPMLKQHLMCQSVIKYELMLRNQKMDELIKQPKKENQLLIRQKKALRSLSPRSDCKEIFKMSQQIEKERVRTGYKVLNFNQTSDKCVTVISPQNTRKLDNEFQFRSVSPASSQRLIISSKHSMFRQQPSRDILLHNFVNSFKN